MARCIFHIDLDAFFASVEQALNPQLKGKPVIVGGDPDRRGVVASNAREG
jgi:DNA polymerase-4